MELAEDSETSANHNLTPGKYPKDYIQYSKHGQSLKSRIAHSIYQHSCHLLCPTIQALLLRIFFTNFASRIYRNIANIFVVRNTKCPSFTAFLITRDCDTFPQYKSLIKQSLHVKVLHFIILQFQIESFPTVV
jgi:hypothetical protein